MGVVLLKPEVEAERLLDNVWTNIAGRHAIPVDAARIATALGCLVFESELDSDVSGAIVKKAGQDPTIIVNRSDHPNRQRFTCAHEIGHFLIKRDNPDEFEYVDLRGPESSYGTEPEEVFANQFAACLLMPQREVIKYASDFGADIDEVQLAYVFKVSLASMSFRLKNLGLEQAWTLEK